MSLRTEGGGKVTGRRGRKGEEETLAEELGGGGGGRGDNFYSLMGDISTGPGNCHATEEGRREEIARPPLSEAPPETYSPFSSVFVSFILRLR